MNIINALSQLSNCQKRATACVLFDAENRPAGFGWNFCAPPVSGCARLKMSQSKAGYTGTECETIHAEIMAIRSAHPKRPPVSAVLYGHDFICQQCEDALRNFGITEMRVMPNGYGTGKVK